MQFPHVDPIPIPAPVWLMKGLSLLTLTLHFFAVQVLIGSLLAVIYFSFSAKGRKDSAASGASLELGRRLPIVMTYVINLGIPPLLFAQVLYGRALYTSSVLIAGQWISVIFLLIACYWLLYRISDRSAAGKSCHWQAIGALIFASIVGHIYALNMTLMLRPEVWKQMYATSASGLQMPPVDPTTEPRFLFVMMGGFLIGGFWLSLHSRVKSLESGVSNLLQKTGASMALVGALGEVGTGYWAYSFQPDQVLSGLNNGYYTAAKLIWAVGTILGLAIAVLQLGPKFKNALFAILGSLGGFLGLAGAVMVRDGIRDVTLFQKGLDVWNRQENSNWFVIGTFLLLLVLGLGAIIWLLLVMKSATPVSEASASLTPDLKVKVEAHVSIPSQVNS